MKSRSGSRCRWKAIPNPCSSPSSRRFHSASSTASTRSMSTRSRRCRRSICLKSCSRSSKRAENRSMEKNLRRAAGSLLVVGLAGTELTGLERAWLRVIRPAGIILFKRNVADVDQTRALLNEATGLGALHSARCVDVEGGTVNRFRDALGPMPSAQAVARAERHPTLSAKSRGKDGAPSLACEHGDLTARAVKAFGCNTTLAPVVDL